MRPPAASLRERFFVFVLGAALTLGVMMMAGALVATVAKSMAQTAAAVVGARS
jgi:purine-cytosine permease-like protein